MRPTSSKEHEEEGKRPITITDTNIITEASIIPSSSSNTAAAIATAATFQPFEIVLPRLPFLSSRTSVRPSSEIAHKISKKKKEHRLNSAFFYFALLLTQQIFVQPIKNNLITSSEYNLDHSTTKTSDSYFSTTFKEELKTKMYSYENTEQYNDGNSHELFDPAIGKFQFGQRDFFTPSLLHTLGLNKKKNLKSI
jgi:hypothetical protein